MVDQIVHWLHLNRLSARAVADIMVLSVVVYQVLLLIRGTRAVQILLGILSLALVYFLTGPDHLLELPSFHRVLGGALFFIPFVIVVLFQNHIRRVLASFGTNPLRGLARGMEGPERIVDDVVLAVTSLASKRYGALIVLERQQGLRSFAEAGIALDALVSYDLLTSIFHPDSTMHDGAVIIIDGRIRAASCFLPLTSSPRLAKDFGSRHRAAIGITEETDAAAIVVSEQRGTISLARDGSIHEDLATRELQDALRSILTPHPGLLSRIGLAQGRAKMEPSVVTELSEPGTVVVRDAGVREAADRAEAERAASGDGT